MTDNVLKQDPNTHKAEKTAADINWENPSKISVLLNLLSVWSLECVDVMMHFFFHGASRPQKLYGLLGTGERMNRMENESPGHGASRPQKLYGLLGTGERMNRMENESPGHGFFTSTKTVWFIKDGGKNE